MKTFLRAALLLTAFATSAAANASTAYNFSYTSPYLGVISGTFSGDADGDFIKNLSAMSANYEGNSFQLEPIQGYFRASQTVSISGKRNDFEYYSAATNVDIASEGSTIYIYMAGFSNPSESDEAIMDSNWKVTQAVPEPETYVMLLAGLGFIGLASQRRKLT